MLMAKLALTSKIFFFPFLAFHQIFDFYHFHYQFKRTLPEKVVCFIQSTTTTISTHIIIIIITYTMKILVQNLYLSIQYIFQIYQPILDYQ